MQFNSLILEMVRFKTLEPIELNSNSSVWFKMKHNSSFSLEELIFRFSSVHIKFYPERNHESTLGCDQEKLH
jgi:hypothetical protein